MIVTSIKEPLFPPINQRIPGGHRYVEIDFAKDHPLTPRLSAHFNNLMAVEIEPMTRKPNEGLALSHKIKITVLDITGNQVRLEINAPRDVNIFEFDSDEETPADAPLDELIDDRDFSLIVLSVGNGAVRLGATVPEGVAVNPSSFLEQVGAFDETDWVTTVSVRQPLQEVRMSGPGIISILDQYHHTGD